MRKEVLILSLLFIVYFAVSKIFVDHIGSMLHVITLPFFTVIIQFVVLRNISSFIRGLHKNSIVVFLLTIFILIYILVRDQNADNLFSLLNLLILLLINALLSWIITYNFKKAFFS